MQPQQHTVLTSPGVDQPTYTSQPYVAPSVVHTYRHRQSTIIGILLIIAGSLSMVFNIVEIAISHDWVKYSKHSITYFAVFGGGAMYITAGQFGMRAAQKKTKGMINAFLAFTIIDAVVAGIQVSFDSQAAFALGVLSDLDYDSISNLTTLYTLEVLLALLGTGAFVLSLWGSILCCATGGCCGTTVYQAVPTGPSQVTVNSQQQQPMKPPAYEQPMVYPPPSQYPGYAPGYEPK